jgi:hypothetical protein
MKLPFLLVLTCASGPSAWAQSGLPIQPAGGVETVASVQETVVTHETAAPTRLRDVFLTAASKPDESTKPYRLTSEERLRLREQVRGQFAFDAPKQ